MLVDECCPPSLTEGLRANGHDTEAVRELASGSGDGHVASIARESGRLLVTFDVGFGDMAIRRGLLPHGVLLLRGFEERSASDGLCTLLRVITEHGSGLLGSMTIIEQDRVRRRPLRTGGDQPNSRRDAPG